MKYKPYDLTQYFNDDDDERPVPDWFKRKIKFYQDGIRRYIQMEYGKNYPWSTLGISQRDYDQKTKFTPVS